MLSLVIKEARLGQDVERLLECILPSDSQKNQYERVLTAIRGAIYAEARVCASPRTVRAPYIVGILVVSMSRRMRISVCKY